MEFSITLIIVIITSIISISGFSNQKVIDDLIFYPPLVKRGQVYRFVTHGLIHADVAHLIFNMLALYSFGEALEKIFSSPVMKLAGYLSCICRGGTLSLSGFI